PIVDAGADQTIPYGTYTTLTGSASGGSGNYSYQWSPASYVTKPNNSTTQTTNLQSTTVYTLLVTDNVTGCSATDNVTITVTGTPLAVPLNVSDNEICLGEQITITAVASGGSGSYTYMWSSNPTGFNPGNTNTGTHTPNLSTIYYVTVNDGYNTTNTSIAVTVNELPDVSISANTPLCEGSNLNLNGTSTTAITYNWTGPNGYTSNTGYSIIHNIQLNQAGWYVLQVTDGNGCSNKDSIQINVLPLPDINFTTNSPVCEGNTIHIEASGGVSYSWSGPNGYSGNGQIININNATEANEGYYVVQVIGANGCKAKDSILIVVNQVPIITITSNSPTCEGATINIQASGGTTYSWIGPNYSGNNAIVNITPASISNAGWYYVTVTDATGCSGTDSIEIIVNNLPIVQITGNNNICEGTQLILTASGGNNYQWSGPNYNGNNSVLLINNIQLTDAGWYYMTVTNNCGSREDSVEVTVKPSPQINNLIGGGQYCVGSNVIIEVTGTYDHISWSGPNGFTSSNSSEVINNINLNQAGWYILTALNNNGCFVKDSIQIIVNPNPQITASNNGPYCEGNTISLTVTPNGMMYNWEGPNGFNTTIQNPIIQNATLNNAGIYTVTVTNIVTGCSSIATTSVIINENPIVVASTDTVVNYGATANLNAVVSGGSGNYSYLWTPSNLVQNANSLTTSTVPMTDTTEFIIQITDNQTGCFAYDTMIVNVIGSQLIVDLSASSISICQGQSVTITVNAQGGTEIYTYTWNSNPAGFYASGSIGVDTPEVTTIYYITVSDGYQYVVDSIIVTVNNNPVISVTAFSNVVCEGQNAIITASGANTYQWSTGDNTPVITPSLNQNTTYYVTGTNAFGCTDVDSITIIYQPYPAPNVTISTLSTTICQGQSATLQATGADNYQWNTGDNTPSISVAPTQSTTYYVTGTNTYGCADTASVTITYLPYPAPDVIITQGTSTYVCEGTTIQIDAVGANTYQWNNGLTQSTINVVPTQTTTYTVTGTDTYGCVDTASITVNVLSNPVVNISGGGAYCEEQTVILTALPANMTYNWSGPNNFVSNNQSVVIPSVQLNQAGTYVVTVIDAYGCSSVETVNIVVNNKPHLIITGDTSLVIYQSAQLEVSDTSGTTIVEYIWTPNEFLNCTDCPNPIANPLQTTQYTVIGINQYGCSDTITYNLIVDTECGNIYIPNAFSPNGDGKHDTWKIYGRCIKEIEVKIFTRWGEKVFESYDVNEGWNGTFRGKPCNSDVFVYTLTVTLMTGEKKSYKGNITILK
ncbi:MAG: gliding motility-associated C-terminal domain-containing protein, partial [Bacteroidales bacterium]|nr:gliding motility-associated C-terminal domain-containing protein [Bacteroidales bacterium]